MTVIYIVVPLAFLIAGAALLAFIWSARSGQLHDLDTPAIRMLADDEPFPSASRASGALFDESSDESVERTPA
ncbi:MAG: cbb3-type cytochrome oxidase assembly protein CcoS [Phycisphaeraceae bacterium]|nr:cbb3-type cytochrome oxidase assembly protein CcoS [Phycisphaeraceae bacterium]